MTKDAPGVPAPGFALGRRLRTALTGSAGNVLWMLLGTGIGQVVALAVSPILTRQYTPADFGLLTVFMSVTSVTGTFVVFRLEAAIPLPASDRTAASVAWIGLGSSFVLSVALGLAGPAIAGPIARLVGSPALETVWWLVAAATLAIALDKVLLTWMVREQRYRALAVRNGLQGVGQAAAQVGLGFGSLRATGLLWGWIIGRVVALGGLFSQGGLFRQGFPRPRELAAAANRYRRFPLLASWSALLNALGQQAPFLVISAYYGSVTIGLLGLTVRVLAAPVTLIGQAVSRVFQGEASEAIRLGNRPLRPIIHSNVRALTAVSAPLALIAVAASPQLFDVIFGSTWRQAGVFAQILALGYVAQLVVSPISQTLLILEKQGQQLAWDASRMIVTVCGPLVAAALGASPTVAIATLSAGYIVCYGALLVTCYGAVNRYDAQLPPRGSQRQEENPTP